MQILHFFFLSLWVIMRTCAIETVHSAVYQRLDHMVWNNYFFE